MTKNARGRTVWRREDEYVAERVRKRMEKEPEKSKRRGATVEKVVGTIKWSMGCENLLMKGLEKCRGEWSLMCACYNIKRAIAILGVERLLEELSSGLERLLLSIGPLRFATSPETRSGGVSTKSYRLNPNRSGTATLFAF